jgi:glycosyltransferase involved in cell wall biosynthesis
MYCGTCIHDNTLAAALQRMGHEVALIPTYTPIRTDEVDVSGRRVFFGGINVFLQQKIALFRHTPWGFDRMLDAPGLLRWLSRFSASTSARDLGELTVSVLEGEHGHQAKELEKLVQWLREDFKPDIVQLTNAMFVGLAARIREVLDVPVITALQGEDVFLEQLVEPYRKKAFQLLADRGKDSSAFIAPCEYYREVMSGTLEVARDRIHVVRPGLNLTGHGAAPEPKADEPFVIGYLARIAPEKGLDELADAFHILASRVGQERVLLRVAGYLGKKDEPYLEEIRSRIQSRGLDDRFEYIGEIDRDRKVAFLNSLHVLSVPAPYKDPKARYVLEALANGVPVVEPDHGVFPELVTATGGGILVDPGSSKALADGLQQLLTDPDRRRRLGESGRAVVHRDFTDTRMAEETLAVYEQTLAAPAD